LNLKNSKSHRKFLGQKWITYEVEQQKSKDILEGWNLFSQNTIQEILTREPTGKINNLNTWVRARVTYLVLLWQVCRSKVLVGP